MSAGSLLVCCFALLLLFWEQRDLRASIWLIDRENYSCFKKAPASVGVGAQFLYEVSV